MKVEQIYTACLAQGAYFISHNGEAAVIDPLREVQPYLDRAEAEGVKIKYVFETHFHADFVSGHLDLAARSGAAIVYGPTAQPHFDAVIAEDGQTFTVGGLSITVLHTPGHTMESSCYLLKDTEGKDVALFTGDTLFLGDVGRPDLAQKAASMTSEQLAALLFKSLREKIMPLSDDVVVYPGHGAGSSCGKNMSDETTDTLGSQKETNYALRANMTEAEFIAEVLDGQLPPPQYFPANVALNKKGYDSIADVLQRGLTPLSPQQVKDLQAAGATVLDVRTPEAFSAGHVPGAVNIGLNGQYAPYVGSVLRDVHQHLVLVCEPGEEEEAVTRLARVGFDHSQGYLQGGIATWQEAGEELATITNIDAEGFLQVLGEGKPTQVLDVRKPSEYQAGHLEDAIHIPLDVLPEHLQQLDKDATLYVHCAGGYRSMIASSVLRRHGFAHLVNVAGGYNAIAKAQQVQA